ncbi:MAG: hypothetical protein RMI91_14615 [Gemmatales bacterium]|nr:hypothetical protein [Gemmatales bacterium]MDW7995878.1 hypothetical protein [Gemmatales bacterium]
MSACLPPLPVSEDDTQLDQWGVDATYEYSYDAYPVDDEFSGDHPNDEVAYDDSIETSEPDTPVSEYEPGWTDEVYYDLPVEDDLVYFDQVADHKNEDYESKDWLVELPEWWYDSWSKSEEHYQTEGEIVEILPISLPVYHLGLASEGANYRLLAFASAGGPVRGLGGEDEVLLFSAVADGGITAGTEDASVLGVTDVPSQGTWNHYDLARWLAWLAQGSNERLNGDLFQWLKRRNDLVG